MINAIVYRKYTYRLAVCRDWELWESLNRSPSTVCFSERNYAWRLPPGFSPERASDVCKLFEGIHVMGSFFKHTAREKRLEPHGRSTVRNILLCQLSIGEPYSMQNDIYDYYNVTFVAKSFVREQVNYKSNIIGFLLQIRRMISCVVFHSYDRLSLRTVRWLLQNPISSNFHDLRIPVAPPQGLFLTEVVYAPEMFTHPFPYYRHSWDYPMEDFGSMDDAQTNA
ncbi:hypothetical protein DICVIV_05784 [Dictyocaulus viviparus]|uniref:tRNA pseudouridine synthase n=1 Tax=Dictyocaulus viviparus TaxID=29172 RepID=A0A0D8XUC6_DICVI|nr:hypothetical protein DICVIV_05784 [Dictyocaulus viviparus]